MAANLAGNILYRIPVHCRLLADCDMNVSPFGEYAKDRGETSSKVEAANDDFERELVQEVCHNKIIDEQEVLSEYFLCRQRVRPHQFKL